MSTLPPNNALLAAIMSERGLTTQDVAEVLTASVKTVQAWLRDPVSPHARVMPTAKLELLNIKTQPEAIPEPPTPSPF